MVVSAPYPDLSTVNGSTSDLSVIFVYANTVTDGYFMPFVAWAFFIIALFASYFGQMRFTGRAKMDVSFLAASFVSVGFFSIMSLGFGLLTMKHTIIVMIFAIVGLMWTLFAKSE